MNQKSPSRSHLKKNLWKFAYAELSSLRAKQACEFIMNHQNDLDSGTYEALVTGIAILYSRPFGGNNAVGPLPKRFGKLGDPRLQDVHEMLLVARNHIHAHTDSSYKYYDEGGNEKEELLRLEIVATRGENGTATIGTQIVAPLLRAEAIPMIKSLCDELLERLGAAKEIVLKKLFEGRKLREGRNPINIFDET